MGNKPKKPGGNPNKAAAVMHLPPFKYAAPKTVARAVSAQKTSGKFLAGGTDLLVALKEKIAAPDILIDLNNIARLKGVKRDQKTKEIRVGALTTLAQLKSNPLIRRHFPVLAQTVALVSTFQLRNMGTLGGNLCLDTRCTYYNQPSFLKKRWEPCLKVGGTICHVVKGKEVCHAVYSGDLASLLIALDAKLRVTGPRGMHAINLKRFFTGSGIKPNILKYNQILTEVRLPPMPAYAGLSYRKLRLRDTMDFPLLGVAVFIELEGKDGKCRDVRLVLGALGPAPLMVEEAPTLLRGRHITPKLIDAVSKAARRLAHPVDNTASSPGYRREMIPLFIKNAFDEALERINH
jgi:4-hydroxybenzoyl-CoA reductase subunit beta